MHIAAGGGYSSDEGGQLSYPYIRDSGTAVSEAWASVDMQCSPSISCQWIVVYFGSGKRVLLPVLGISDIDGTHHVRSPPPHLQCSL